LCNLKLFALWLGSHNTPSQQADSPLKVAITFVCNLKLFALWLGSHNTASQQADSPLKVAIIFVQLLTPKFKTL